MMNLPGWLKKALVVDSIHGLDIADYGHFLVSCSHRKPLDY
jgi:hypothetical protein